VHDACQFSVTAAAMPSLEGVYMRIAQSINQRYRLYPHTLTQIVSSIGGGTPSKERTTANVSVTQIHLRVVLVTPVSFLLLLWLCVQNVAHTIVHTHSHTPHTHTHTHTHTPPHTQTHTHTPTTNNTNNKFIPETTTPQDNNSNMHESDIARIGVMTRLAFVLW